MEVCSLIGIYLLWYGFSVPPTSGRFLFPFLPSGLIADPPLSTQIESPGGLPDVPVFVNSPNGETLLLLTPTFFFPPFYLCFLYQETDGSHSSSIIDVGAIFLHILYVSDRFSLASPIFFSGIPP